MPKFLWAADATAAAGRGRQSPPIAKARADRRRRRARARYLRAVADLYRISGRARVDALPMHHRAALPGRRRDRALRQSVDGIEVFREQVNVLVDKRGDARRDRRLRDRRTARRTQGRRRSRRRAGGGDRRRARRPRVRRERRAQPCACEGGRRLCVARAAERSDSADGASLAAPMRAKRVWFRMRNELVPAWYVEVQVRDARAQRRRRVLVRRVGRRTARSSSATISASRRRVLAIACTPSRRHRTCRCRARADAAASRIPTGTPDGYQPPFVTPQPRHAGERAVLAQRSRGSRPSANRTQRQQRRGVHEHARARRLRHAGHRRVQPLAAGRRRPARVHDGAQHRSTTPTTTVSRRMPIARRSRRPSPISSTSSTTCTTGSTTRDSTKPAGNAQTNNYGRGGLGNDSIFAEAQDFTGTNNANMFTPADGQRPRMRMFLWTSGLSIVKVDSPAAIAGVKTSNTAEFGAQAFDLTADARASPRRRQRRRPARHRRLHAATPTPRRWRARSPSIDRGTCTLRGQGQERAGRGRGRRRHRQQRRRPAHRAWRAPTRRSRFPRCRCRSRTARRSRRSSRSGRA